MVAILARARQDMRFVSVEWMDEVLPVVLLQEPASESSSLH